MIIVRESLDFERGKDPKRILRIGRLRQLEPYSIIKCKKRIKPNLVNTPDSTFYIEPSYYSIIKRAEIVEGIIILEVATFNKLSKLLREPDIDFLGGEFLNLTEDEFFEHFEFVDPQKMDESVSFERGLDPKKSMKIGTIYSPRKMKDTKETAEWFLSVLPAILGTHSIPPDVINTNEDGMEMFPEKYYKRICDYIEEYMGEVTDFTYALYCLYNMLDEKGYPMLKESFNFERGRDAKKTLNIGLRNRIAQWLEDNYHGLSNATKASEYTINDDLTIDVDGFFSTSWKGNFPEYIQFRNTGPFNVQSCELTSLRGCPKHVEGEFNCARNNLKNFIGGPEYVKGHYTASLNPNIESFEGLAKTIMGDFSCNNKSELTELDIPKDVYIGGNPNVHYWANW